MRLLLIAVLFLTAVFHISAAGSLASDGTAISARMSGETGIIELKQQQKTRFKANIDGSTLIITFEEPVNAQLFGLLSGLRELIDKASFTADKKQILANLKKPCSVAVTNVGEVSTIELRPNGSKETKPATPPTPQTSEKNEQPAKPEPAKEAAPPIIADIYQKSPDAAKNATTDVVKVITAAKDDHAEIRFQWPRKVEYRIFHKPDSILIEFDDSAPSMPPAIKGEIENYISTASNRTLDGHLIYTFTFPGKSAFAHRKDGNDVVLDIKPLQQIAGKNPEPATPSDTKEPAKEKEAHKSTAAPVKNTEVEVTTLAPSDVASSDDKTITPEHKIENGTEIISFQWGKPTAAAMLIRDRQGWIVFDRQAKANISKLMRSKSEFIENANATEAKNATIFSFRLKKKTKAHMLKKGDEWQVVLAAGSSQIAPSVTKTESDKGNEALIAVRQPAQPVTINDDVTGQIISVIPLPDDNIATTSQRRFVDFNLLETGQGIAIEILNDQLKLSVSQKGIQLSTGNGLNLSHKQSEPAETAKPPPEQKAETKTEEKTTPIEITEKKEEQQTEPAPANTPPPPPAKNLANTVFLTQEGKSFLPYELWKTPEGQTFHNITLLLNHERLDKQADERAGPRTRAARYLMAEGLYPEALSILSLLHESNPGYIAANRLSALEGIAHFMRGDFKEATTAFAQPELSGSAETELWKKIVGSADGSLKTPLAINEEQFITIASYPEPVKQAVTFALIDKFMRDKNYEAAQIFLSHLSQDGISESEQDKIELYRGLLAVTQNDSFKAIKIFGDLQNSKNRMIATKAGAKTIELLLAQGKIPPAEAIKKLEPMLIKWRGDEVEMDVMRLLSQLYIDNGNYREGMEILRDLVANFNETETATQAAVLMNSTFVDLFTKGKADNMAPLDALSLYYEFRELTPLNRDGDIMIQKLADRMVQVDLLERAAALLSHQVKYRISGGERARVATRLAYIHLRNREPQLAIDALETTDKEAIDIPDDAKEIRRHLYAEALIKLKRYDEAIPVVEHDTSSIGQRLAIEALWNSQNWKKAESYLQTVLNSNPPDSSKPLSSGTAEQIMRLALVYQFTNSNDGLSRLRAKYGEIMKKSPYADSFTFLTEPISKLNHLNIEKMEDMMKQFGSVMKELDRKVEGDGLSKAIP